MYYIRITSPCLKIQIKSPRLLGVSLNLLVDAHPVTLKASPATYRPCVNIGVKHQIKGNDLHILGIGINPVWVLSPSGAVVGVLVANPIRWRVGHVFMQSGVA